MDLEHKLTVEVERSRALERALEEQTHKLEQFRNWSTAKVTTLDHALQAQERLLQQVERRMAEKHDKPDIKSDYLIALQKDFVELNARLAALEGKQDDDDDDEEEEKEEDPVKHDQHTSTQAPENNTRSSSPQYAVLGRSTPSAYVSRLLEERSLKQDGRDKVRAYSTPPLAVATRRAAQSASVEPGRSPSPWKPSSPANLASKLVPPTTPGSPSSNSRSAPATPTSRSPRPRYTTALGNKAPSPLGFSSAARTRESSGFNHSGSAGSSPSKDIQFSRYRQSASPTQQQHHYARPTLASSRYAAATTTTTTTTATTATHVVSPTGRRFSTGYNRNRPNRPPLVPVTPHGLSSKRPSLGRKKAAVGDLIKMFDGPK